MIELRINFYRVWDDMTEVEIGKKKSKKRLNRFIRVNYIIFI